MLYGTILCVLVLSTATARKTPSPKEQLYRLGLANNYFAVNLHKTLAESTDENVFFSPFAVSSVLTMLYRGAKGSTAAELKSVLGYGKLNDSTVLSTFRYYLTEVIGKMNPKVYTINSVSAMVIDNTFPVLPNYRTEMQDVFQAYIQDANVAEEGAAVVDKMNTWAKIKTRGTITKLAEQIDPETTLFLASAAYFKGAWKVKFDPKDTKPHPFYNRGDQFNSSDVQMMHAYAFVRYYEDDDDAFTAVELLYEGRNMSMVIYLPDKVDELSELENNMTAFKMSQVRRQMYFMKVHLSLPKFKLKVDRCLSRALKSLGLTKIFKYEADLSGMIPEGSVLALDEVVHKAMIEVNEKGSVAAAVTRAVMTRSMPLSIPDPEFKVDHPFLFAIFDIRSSLMLFMGRVNILKG